MPSPFPGMDPYLEGALWTTFHFTFGAEIVRQLNPKLRPHYVALLVERFVVEDTSPVSITTTSLYPDVSVVETNPRPAEPAEKIATASPLRLATVMPEAIPHVSIEIRDAAHRQLVTAIEILSPTNKQGEGVNEYLTKRRRLLLSSVHLIEIDLLHRGRRVPMQQPLPSAPYFVFLSRADERPMTETWPIQLNEALPIIPIPLLPESDDVLLDLQEAFTTGYDNSNYDLIIDYGQQPEISLPDAETGWLETCLRNAGLRS